MLSPKDFVSHWGKDSPLVRFRQDALEKLTISDEDKAFLVQAGLPQSAPPFLNFEAPKSGALPTVADAWRQSAEFRRYRIIGFDGAGSPIALDQDCQGEVACLDHDDKFSRTVMNKTVRQLAESLLAYRKALQSSKTAKGNSDDSDPAFPQAVREKLFKELRKIDPAAVKFGCFWANEVQISDASDEKLEYPATVLRDLQSTDPKLRLKASRKLSSDLRKRATKQVKELFGNQQATTPLIAAIDDPDPEVVQNALTAIAQISAYFKDDRAYDKVIKFMRSEYGHTHGWAICAAIRLREEDSLDEVLPLCSEKSYEIRDRVFLELFNWLRETKRNRPGGVRPENQARLLDAALRAFNDPKSKVSGCEVHLLAEFGDAITLAILQARLKKKPDSSVEEAIEKIEKRLSGNRKK
jgi:hypothetical protein